MCLLVLARNTDYHNNCSTVPSAGSLLLWKCEPAQVRIDVKSGDSDKMILPFSAELRDAFEDAAESFIAHAEPRRDDFPGLEFRMFFLKFLDCAPVDVMPGHSEITSDFILLLYPLYLIILAVQNTITFLDELRMNVFHEHPFAAVRQDELFLMVDCVVDPPDRFAVPELIDFGLEFLRRNRLSLHGNKFLVVH